MTSKLVVNTIESDTGISSVSFASSISMSSTSKFHFSAAGIDIGADTNINRPAAGVLGFNINSSEKLRITSDGKVGIGTDNPTYKLHVDSGDAAIGLWKSRRSSGSYIDYSVGADGAALGFIGAGGQIISSGADSGDFAIRSQGNLCFASGGSTERVRITSDGNLNINSSGLSSPWSSFRHISINNNLILNAQNTAGGFAGMQNNAYLNSSGNWVRVNNDHATSIGTDDGNFYFRNAGAGTGNISWNHRLTILANGHIGINQSSPQTGLHINQDWVNSYGSISVEGSANVLVGLGLRSNGNYRGSLIWRDGSSGNYLDIATYGGAYPILFRPNGTERVRVQDGGLKLNGGSYIMEISAGHGAPNNNNKVMDQRRWMWYGASSQTHTVARVAKASSGSPGDGDSMLAAFIVTYTARSMYSFNSGGGYSVMKMRTGRINYNNDTVHFSTEQDTLGTGSGSQNPTIVFTDEGSGVVRISITNPGSTHSFGEINLMTYDCRITLPSG